MPIRKTKRRRRRRGRRGRKRSRMGRPTIIRMPGTITADAVMTKLVYPFSSKIQPGTVFTRRVFNGNSLHLPNPNVPSQQPIGFDQWALIYLRYEVIASKVQNKVINLDQTGPIQWVVYPAYDTTNVSFNSACGQPYAKRQFSDLMGSGNSESSVTSYMSTHKLLGRAPVGDSYAATVTTSPAKKWEWIFEMINPEGTNPLVFEMQAVVTFYVRFFERKTLTDS